MKKKIITFQTRKKGLPYLNTYLFVRREKRYKRSRKLLTLGFRSLNEHNLLETVLPRLRDLRDEVQEASYLGVLGEKKGIFIEQAQGNHTFRFVLSPSKSFGLHCSAQGKAIMAYLPNNFRDRYLSYMEFTSYNDRTFTSPEVYLEELETVQKRGYTIDNEEDLNGVICIGCPILNYMGYPCGAIWILDPKDQLSKEVIRTSATCIKKIALEISAELRYSKVSMGNLPYPYKEKSHPASKDKTARDDSYIERLKFSTSYSRKGYNPYQRGFNVSFRMIIED